LGYQVEQALSLRGGKKVRKDAIKGDEAVIIKPDTPSGHAAAKKRAQLMEDNGYRATIEYYDPTDPRFQPGSPTYRGPAKR